MDVEDLYRLLRTDHVQAQAIVDTVADPMLLLDESLHVQSGNRAFFETFKVDRYETIGKPIHELGDGQWDIPALRLLLLEVIPRSAAIIDYEVEHDFPGLGRKTMLLTARTLHHPDNGSHTMLLSIVDVTERTRRDATRDMLFGELRHRMKNLLSVAQSIVRRTTTEGRTAEEYREDLLGRFGALADAHDVGFAEQGATGLALLIERLLAPYSTPEAVMIVAGPPVVLGPNTLMALGLVLHELSTNAAKYGALSVPTGRVSIGWQNDEAVHELRIVWIERGGPPVTPPQTAGFGSKMIRSAIAVGKVSQVFAAEGLEVEIVIPLGPASLAD
ncbi:HWE histidine kinase domain-containing protein [Pleomorphomonas oryzae]|uniref:HWE histidine kinase domain-containing protein n=1 Tax=Pleomorphomonas oryzae TaxID=261934 RepID=UPI0003F81357|nr:HWE histidine kinase domain-containing protein [Pleomorphomonas oryzae]